MLSGDLLHQFLHIAARTFPPVARPAQRLLVDEVRPAGSDPLEILLIIELRFIPRSIDQPELPPLAAILAIVREKVFDKPTHGCDPSPGSDKNAVGQRCAQQEQPMRPVKLKAL